MDISHFSERDICTKYVIPALIAAGWLQHQWREEVGLTAGRVMVRGKLAYRLQSPGVKVTTSASPSTADIGDTLLFTPFPSRLMLGACLGSHESSYPASPTM
ncbi:MAG: hypothetical protein WBM40_00720 [Thiohalocapsa sp.]